MNATNQTITPQNLVAQTSPHSLDQLVTHMQQVLHNAEGSIDKALAETRQLINTANQQLNSLQPQHTIPTTQTPITANHPTPSTTPETPVIATRHVDETVTSAVQQQSQPDNQHLINTMHTTAQQHLANAETAIQKSISAINSSIAHQAQVLDQQANHLAAAATQEGQTSATANQPHSSHGQTT